MLSVVQYNMLEEMTLKEKYEFLGILLFYDMMAANHYHDNMGNQIKAIIKACSYCKSRKIAEDDFEEVLSTAIHECESIGLDIKQGLFNYVDKNLAFEEYMALSGIIFSNVFETVLKRYSIAYKQWKNAESLVAPIVDTQKSDMSYQQSSYREQI